MAGVLYKKEREVLEYLAQFQRQYGYSPTLGEIAKATGHRSNATIHAIIRSLVEKGYVQKVEGNARVLKIIDQKIASTMTGVTPSIEVPLMGYLEQGKPLTPHEDPNAAIQISSTLISGKHTAFALQVKETGFIKDAILANDILVVEKTPETSDGDIVIVNLDGNTTVKKYIKTTGQITLHDLHNSDSVILPTSLTVIGKIVALVRKF